MANAVETSEVNVTAAQYGVPADLLFGIWQREASGAYPNPWENGLGYGGEFGTRMGPAWGPASEQRQIPGGEPPFLTQVETSAKILAQDLQQSGGSIADALHAYSGGGYTTVPGETTFGKWTKENTGGNGNPINSTTSPSGAQQVGKAASSAASGLASGTEALVLRALMVIGGVALILVGLLLIARSLGVGPGVAALGKVGVKEGPLGEPVKPQSASTDPRLTEAKIASERERAGAYRSLSRQRLAQKRNVQERRLNTKADREKEFNRGYIERATEVA